MPSNLSYRVETLSPAALLLGPDSWLLGQLRLRLEEKHFRVLTDPSALPADFALEYVLVTDQGIDLAEQRLSALLALHSPRLVYLAHHSQRPAIPALPPGSLVALYSDVIGPDYTLAPTLTAFLDSAGGAGELVLPGDGLADYHLLSDRLLVDGVYRLLTASITTSPLILADPQGISLLSLAYLIRGLLTRELKLTFDDSLSWSDYSYPWDQILALYQQLDWQPRQNLTSLLTEFIGSYLAKLPPTPATATFTSDERHPATPNTIPLQDLYAKTAPITPHLTKLSDLAAETSTQKSRPKPTSPQFVPLPESRPKPPRHVRARQTLPSLNLKSRIFHLKSRLRPPRPLAIVGGGLVFAFALYLLILVTSLTMTTLTLRSYRDSLSADSLPPRSSLSAARLPAVFLEANLVALSIVPGFKSQPALASLTNLISSYRLGLDSLLLTRDLADTSSELLHYVLAGGDANITGIISLARLQSAELYESLSLLDGALPQDPPALLPPRFKDPYLSLKTSLGQLRRHTLTAKALLAAAPDLLGVGDRRKYLVLFQNNMELRATGGFIGSFAILSFENGELYDLPIYDVYMADGQLKGHVEPPAEIKKYLGEANWYLRDSNWDPDFPTSASRAQWFLEKTLETEVQGTIAVNVYSLASLLDALGPVSLLDYQEEVTASNIFERAEYHAEVNFFPGSTQKKEFLSSVADALFSRLSSLGEDQALPVARALAEGLDEKNTLLSVSTPASDHAFSALGWNGELRTPPCPILDQTCYSDYAMLVDSNLGVNKANYFLRRSLALDVTISDKLALSHLLTVQYQNTSTSGAWPAGTYKNYSRLYLPEGAIFDSLKVDGITLGEEAVSLSAEHGRTVVGFLVQVPINSSVKVELAYRLSHSLLQEGATYSLYWQKQPGTAPDPLTITLNYPLFMKPDLVSPQADLKEQQLQFNLSNITDRRVTVKFK